MDVGGWAGRPKPIIPLSPSPSNALVADCGSSTVSPIRYYHHRLLFYIPPSTVAPEVGGQAFSQGKAHGLSDMGMKITKVSWMEPP